MKGKTLGIIAGKGTLPVMAARAARRLGFRVVVSLVREVRTSFPAGSAGRIETVSVGRVGDTLGLFEEENVGDVLFVGKIDKQLNFSDIAFDDVGLSLLARLPSRSDMSIAALIIEEFERRGYRVRKQTDFLGELLAAEGPIAGPDGGRFRDDIKTGLKVARALAAFDVGQTVVVRQGAVIAVEAFEHTDATIRRAGKLAGGDLVVVKVARPGQDLRFDVPAVGPGTIRVMAKAGAAVLAVEAGKSLILDRRRLARLADETGIAVLGVTQ